MQRTPRHNDPFNALSKGRSVQQGCVEGIMYCKKGGFSRCPPKHIHAEMHCHNDLPLLHAFKWGGGGAISKVQERRVEGTMNCPKGRFFISCRDAASKWGPSQRCKKGVWRALWIAQNNVKFIMPSSPFMLKWGGHLKGARKVCGGHYELPKKKGFHNVLLLTLHAEMHTPTAACILNGGGGHLKGARKVWRALWIAQKEGFSQCPPPHPSCRDAHSHCCMNLKWGAISKVQERCVAGTMNCPK